jgi:hypothetical protein
VLAVVDATVDETRKKLVRLRATFSSGGGGASREDVVKDVYERLLQQMEEANVFNLLYGDSEKEKSL